MAGLSMSRRAALARTATSAVTNSSTKKRHAIHRHHPLTTRSGDNTALSPYAVDRELPAAWAFVCMSFAGIIEFTRIVSPSKLSVDLVSKFNAHEDKEKEPVAESQARSTFLSKSFSWLSKSNTQSALQTVADYTIGGAIGGAFFTGSAVRTPAGRKIDAAILGAAIRGGGLLAGLLPGAGLGLLAGVTIVSIDYATEMLEERFGEADEQLDELPEQNEMVQIQNNGEPVPESIKAMSNEELARAIEELKK